MLKTALFFCGAVAFVTFSPVSPLPLLWVYIFCAAIPKCATETWTLHQKVSIVCLYFEINIAKYSNCGLPSSKYFIIKWS